jgi:hypothetical protein
MRGSHARGQVAKLNWDYMIRRGTIAPTNFICESSDFGRSTRLEDHTKDDIT